MPGTTDPASLDAMFDALRDSHRRRVLLAVSDHNPREKDEFTRDDEVDDSGADPDDVKSDLHHFHLPKLAESGYIEWNPDAQTIRRGPNFDEIAPLLRLMAENEDELPDDLL